jgi:hypothetical protein
VPTNEIIVVGSNLDGRHGKGAALMAKEQYGAVYGVGVGRSGNAYLIPTKGHKTNGYLPLLSLEIIASHVRDFIKYAHQHPELSFKMTEIGCGLARGNKTRDQRRAEIAPLFRGSPSNVIMPVGWKPFLHENLLGTRQEI